MAKTSKTERTASMKMKENTSNAIIYIILTLMSIIWMLPYVCMVLQSFISNSEFMTNKSTYLIPKHFSLDNYIFLFTSGSGFIRWYLNTLLIATVVAALQTIIVLCVSYALSRMRFKGRKLLMRAWLILGMFPGFLTMICLYFMLSQMGLTGPGAIPGLILVNVASSGMGYYVCKGYFDTVPKALDEAARIDGASRARIFLTIITPMSKPIVIYTALCAFLAPWCDYIFASYIAWTTKDSWNVAVGLASWVYNNDFQTKGYITYFYAGGILVAIPVTILFMFLQRYYVEGVTGGAVKG